MELDLLQKQDLGHRLLHWAHDHKNHIILTLVGGVLFFGVLAGTTAWLSSSENKAQSALYSAKADKEALEKTVSDFPRSKAALLALIDLGAQASANKNFEECVSRYEKVYDKAGNRAYFRVLALHEMAVCQRGKGDFAAAAALFERASKEPGNEASLISRFEEARSLQEAKDPKAKTVLDEILKDKEITPELKKRVEEQLAWPDPKK